MKILLAAILVALGLFLTPSAFGQSGSSAIAEYTENPSTADGSGDGTSFGGRTDAGAASDGSAQPSIPPSSVRGLEQFGADGEAARQLAIATAPDVPGGGGRSSVVAGGAAEDANGGSLPSIAGALADSRTGGTGLIFPIAVVAILLLGLVLALRKRRLGDAAG